MYEVDLAVDYGHDSATYVCGIGHQTTKLTGKDAASLKETFATICNMKKKRPFSSKRPYRVNLIFLQLYRIIYMYTV